MKAPTEIAQEPHRAATTLRRPTLPELPAVYVTVCAVEPPVIVPLVMPHE